MLPSFSAKFDFKVQLLFIPRNRFKHFTVSPYCKTENIKILTAQKANISILHIVQFNLKSFKKIDF